jgi:uncharacterized membrane protein YraQ (UPF0718 family)
MSKVMRIAANNKFLVLVALIYAALFVFLPGKAIASFQNSLYYIREMLLIMPVVLLLTSLINAWVPREAIERNLGENSGIKGAVFSFLFGSLSAGPIYAAFPVSKALLAKGASISNIVILLSTWAVVKVPMLINEAKFLGPQFMAARWVLTTISIFIMGFATARLVSKEDLPLDEPGVDTATDTIAIKSEYCTGCGLCAKIAPTYFEVEQKKARVIKQDIGIEGLERVKEAIARCPAKIIGLGQKA